MWKESQGGLEKSETPTPGAQEQYEQPTPSGQDNYDKPILGPDATI